LHFCSAKLVLFVLVWRNVMSLASRGLSRTTTILPLLMSVLVTMSLGSACGGGAKPSFETLGDQIGQVGVELKVELKASDADGDRLSYRFSSDVPNLGGRATVARTPTDSGIFRWTPMASDQGDWNFDFIVSDGDNETKTTVKITIKPSTGVATAPIFREPLGSGTTIDLTRTPCVDLNVLIEDQDTAQVDIAQEEPAIEGASINAIDGVSAAFHWCPTQAQADAESRYTLTLSANDNDNAKTLKNYLIVLRGRVRPDCPGEPPAVVHTPANATSILDLSITADVSDDLGLKQAPLLYYSSTQPSSPPDLSQMTQLSMTLQSGTNANGTWTVKIPNPVQAQPAGTSTNIYYVIVADDDDDTMGNCDHVTTSSNFVMKVTSSGTGDAGLCNQCSGDRQCGNDGDLCVRVGASGGANCLQACNGATCPTGYTCSPSPVSSVDGAMAKQCVPISGSCTDLGAMCMDDMHEEDDSRTQASALPITVPNIYALTSCPRTGSTSLGDDDWFKLKLNVPSRVTLEVVHDGAVATDLDLGLYKSDGTRLSVSSSRASDEKIIKCIAAGTYYSRVYAFGHARQDYILSYDATAETCPVCTDDTAEDDDTASQARPKIGSNPVTLPFSAATNQICPSDDDWYRVRMVAGDKVKADIRFTQSNSLQDLDLHFYNAAGTDLTPCSDLDPTTCNTANGQSADSDELMTQNAPSNCGAGCDVYFVVRGYAGSSSPYSITIAKIP
jgi:hypothetical protein